MKNILKPFLLLLLIGGMLSAYSPDVLKIAKVEREKTEKWLNERYWYASDDATYVNRHQTIAAEMSTLSAAQPAYNFYSTQVSGSLPYEFGYNIQSPAGDPAETIFRKLK